MRWEPQAPVPCFNAFSREPCGMGPAYLQAQEEAGFDSSSLSDVSAMSAGADGRARYLQTPAQLRPSSEWVPQTPASREQPPSYDGRRPAAEAVPAGPRMEGRRLFAPESARMPSQTQLTGINFKDEYVIDGQEIALGQRGKIPTPARSQRGMPGAGTREIAIQANRQSIDGHALRAGDSQGSAPAGQAATQAGGRQHRLVSIIRRNGAPSALDEDEEDTAAAPPPDSSRTWSDRGVRPVSEVQYPEASPELAGPAKGGRPATWQGRAAMAQALSQAITDEMAELERAWQLEEPDAKGRTEHVVAVSLRKIAKKAEKAGVTQALLPSASPDMSLTGVKQSAERDDGLQARCARLEAELAEADARLASLSSAGDREAAGEPQSSREALGKVVASLSAQAGAEGGDDEATGTVDEQATPFEAWLQRLAGVDAALRRQHAQLEDSRQELEERERAAAAHAFSHLPAGALDGIGALMVVP